MLPTFARIQDDAERMRSGFFTSTRLTSLVSFPIFLGMSVLSTELTELFFGSRWSQSAPVLQMFAIVGLLQSMQMFNGTLIISMGKPSWRFYLSIGSFITTSAVVLASAPYGLNVMVIAQAIRALLWAPVAVVLVRRLRLFYWWDYLKNLGPSMLAAVAMFGAILLAQSHISNLLPVYVRLLVHGVVGGGTYVLTLYALSRNSIREAVEFVHLIFTRNRTSQLDSGLT